MQPYLPMNRQTLRGINAQGRRLARSLGACGPSCTPASHPIDGISGRTGLGKYSGITAALGVAIKNDDLVRASQRQDDAPPLLRRVSTIAAVVAMAATDRPRAQWYSTIADITTAQTAEAVRLLVKKMPVREEDAIAYSLTVVFLMGAVGEKAGENGDAVLAYRKAMAALDGALESIRRREVSRVNGLFGLGAPPRGRGSGTRSQQQSAPKIRTPSGNKLSFSEIPTVIGTNINPEVVFRYAVQFVNNNDGYDALTQWSVTPPSWIPDAEKDSFRLAAFAVGRLPELAKAKGMAWGQPYGFFNYVSSSAGALSQDALGTWAVAPPDWRRTTPADTVGSSLTYLISGFKKHRGLTVCAEDVKYGADWITEACGIRNTAENRNSKIEMVKAAWAAEFPGKPIDACTINYYTRLKWCSVNTYRGVMKEKEAAGRPAPTKADTERTFENTAAGQAVQELSASAKTGVAIVEAFLSGNISEGIGLIVKVLGDIGKTASQFLCSAINLIFKDSKGEPTPAGQVLCAIITFLVGGFFDKIRGGAAIAKAIFDGLGKFFSELAKGNFKEAGRALVDATNVIVLILLAGDFTLVLGLPMVDQELTADQRAKGYKSIESLAKDLGFDFTVGLVAAGVGFILGGPQPNNVASIITALSPAVALVLAPVLKNDPRSPESIRKAPLETIKKGIQAIMKIGALVTVNVMNNRDVFEKFANALMKYAQRVYDDPAKEGKKLKASFEKNFAKQWEDFKFKMSNGKFEEKVAAIKNLTNFFPDLLVAIAMDDPDLAQIYQTGKQIFELGKQTYEEAKKIWEEAMKEEPDPRARLKAMRDSLNTVRAQLDELCQKYPDDPSCQFPTNTTEKIVKVEKIVEKPVVVEKIVYRDRAGGSSSSGPSTGMIAGLSLAAVAAIALVSGKGS